MATSTLAPVTSFLPLPVLCTCMMARWMTRWKPSVGWVSTSSAAGHRGRVLLDEGRQALAQVVDVGGAGAQHLGGAGVVQQRHQQVLDGDEFVPLLARLDERHVQADFKFLGDHAASIMHCSGCPRGARQPAPVRPSSRRRPWVDAAHTAPFVVDLQHDAVAVSRSRWK
jgi:hypothetical protein